MSHRNFDPRRDAVTALQNGWLYPGERPAWAHGFNSVRYEVKGRKRDGVPKWHPVLRVLGWILLSPFMVIKIVNDIMLVDFGEDTSGAPIAFGPHSNCQAALLTDSDANEYRAFWVLTDRRFASVAADPVAGGSPSTLAKGVEAVRDLGQITTGSIHTLPAEPVRLRTVWELNRGQHTYQGVVSRERDEYHRVTLPDGSGIDFPRRPGG